ncbi:MAG: hypothetical protein ABI581_12080 [Sediminibacterium sp.]
MSIQEIIQLYKSADVKELDSFFIREGFSLTRTHRQDSHGKEVGAGEELVTTYTWEPVEMNAPCQLTSANFTQWADDSLHVLDMQLNGETLFNQWMQELRSSKEFKKRTQKKDDRVSTRFFNREKEINLIFMQRQVVNLTIPDFFYYNVFMHFKSGRFKS